jgi:hypothetical protein
MGNLEATFRDQRRLKETKELLVLVMQTRKKVLGQEHLIP